MNGRRLALILIVWSLTIIFPLMWVIYESLRRIVSFSKTSGRCRRSSNGSITKKAWKKYRLGTTLLNTLYYVGASLVLGTCSRH